MRGEKFVFHRLYNDNVKAKTREEMFRDIVIKIKNNRIFDFLYHNCELFATGVKLKETKHVDYDAASFGRNLVEFSLNYPPFLSPFYCFGIGKVFIRMIKEESKEEGEREEGEREEGEREGRGKEIENNITFDDIPKFYCEYDDKTISLTKVETEEKSIIYYL